MIIVCVVLAFCSISQKKQFDTTTTTNSSNNTNTNNSADNWLSEDCPDMHPVPFFINHKVKSIICGEQHAIAKCGSDIVAWGMNGNGQLGDGTAINKQLPVVVRLPVAVTEEDVGVSVVVAAAKHSGIVIHNNM